eukprot:CAMPEP_0113866560 /NCGR_PEP_ID=MMETSP0372-20130328/19185_1 /TAXON_ID=340204 /ORGANISM="Lankesteria abbotti" /LENGTH=205 /DNA_ID=CAMNT_0000851337 /DNA_START=269 /DNA_END=886 /DNA_ORIENTATION=- /assembly_acc=CAM_ASM_000359
MNLLTRQQQRNVCGARRFGRRNASSGNYHSHIAICMSLNMLQLMLSSVCCFVKSFLSFVFLTIRRFRLCCRIPNLHLFLTRVIDSAVDLVTLFAEFQTHTVGSTAEMGVAGYVAVSYVGVTATGLFGPDLSYQFLQVSSVANSAIPFTFGVPCLDVLFLLSDAASQSSDSVIVQWDSSSSTDGSALCAMTPSTDVVNVDVLAVTY